MPTPVVELNAAVAVGMATGLERGLAWIAKLEAHPEMARYHLLPAAKADMLRRLGRFAEAADAYRQALALVTNPAEQPLPRKASRLLVTIVDRRNVAVFSKPQFALDCPRNERTPSA